MQYTIALDNAISLKYRVFMNTRKAAEHDERASRETTRRNGGVPAERVKNLERTEMGHIVDIDKVEANLVKLLNALRVLKTYSTPTEDTPKVKAASQPTAKAAAEKRKKAAYMRKWHANRRAKANGMAVAVDVAPAAQDSTLSE